MADSKPAEGKPGKAADAAAGAAPTHVLHLSDGSTRDGYGAIPTHYTEGDKVFRVVSAEER